MKFGFDGEIVSQSNDGLTKDGFNGCTVEDGLNAAADTINVYLAVGADDLGTEGSYMCVPGEVCLCSSVGISVR